MKSSIAFWLIQLVLLEVAIAQSNDGVGVGTTSVNEDAIFEVESSNKGVLIPRMASAERVAINTSSDGLLVYDTDQSALFVFDGSQWMTVGPPAGTIVMWSGTTPPNGWALCDGTNGPDLRGRFVVGYHSGDSDYNSTGKTGGEKAHKLTASEMPGHNHSIGSDTHSHTASTSGSDGAHSHTINWSDGVPPKVFYRERAGGGNATNGYEGSTTPTIPSGGTHGHQITVNSDTHTHAMGNTGGSQAHENRPPYYVLAYIIKL
ncbi:tail fiber protein [Marinoscillum sp. MHG1-6]|uniref:tail fiber protein n=1 Tax=Marinoscillum sp. MHG1-6 TaxID=2959627 RepID=UPI0021576A75|nr:tail fiber protein [Marinoscillum sp. MHG1-6]